MSRFITTIIALALVMVLVGAWSPAQAQTAAPGLYVTNLRLSPAQPAFNQDVLFYANMSNTTTTVQNFGWKVYIYRADIIGHSVQETSIVQTGFPVGASETQSLGKFNYGPTGFQCEYFYAMVGWLDSNNKIIFFPGQDGKAYQKGFTVCDANIIPTAVASTSAAPAATAVPTTPGPGLYVSNLRLSPAQPAFNQDVLFYANMSNTATTVQNFNWKVYIYRADIIGHSIQETSILSTGFPVGASETQSLGKLNYGPTGFQCEYFYAMVGWLDSNNKIIFFPGQDGKPYQKGFPICDSSVIPTAVPASPAPTAVAPPPPGPGLFVTDVRLQPFGTPQHRTNTTFFPKFQNTSNTVQGFNWKVYVYRADTPNVSAWETSLVQGNYAVGTTEDQALNTFYYGVTGFDCDYFFLRVGWLDSNNKITFFASPSGQMFQKGFSVCN